jgi:type I restriction enzyme S subunit
MERVKLKELCFMQSGGTPSRGRLEYYVGNIPWAKISDLEKTNDGYISYTEEHISDDALKSINNRFFKEGTLLLAMYGSVGKTAITKIELSTNQAILGINILDESILDIKYLRFWFTTIKEQLLNRAVGAALANISLGIVKDLEIPLPPLSAQQKIATILDKADELRQYNKQLIEKYDELTQSLFLNMFGDPVNNEKGFIETELINLVEDKNDIKCGPFGTQLSKSEYVESGVPIWGIPQVNSLFIKKPTEYITNQKAIVLKQYSVLPNDIVMSRKGNVGKCAIYPNDWEIGILHSDALRIRCDINKISPVFLTWQFRISRSLATQVDDVSSGAIMQGINVGKLKNIRPIVPPIALQNQFAERVQLIEIQKQQAQEALTKSEQLFQGLLQQAFKGEMI